LQKIKKIGMESKSTNPIFASTASSASSKEEKKEKKKEADEEKPKRTPWYVE